LVAESYKSFDFPDGIEGEYARTEFAQFIAGADRIKIDYYLFPSVHLGYTFPTNISCWRSFSHAQRSTVILQEQYIKFEIIITEIGNQDIRPEYIDSYELIYKKNLGRHTISTNPFAS
jgi:hypothetical protein